jgi:hypothetical protein
VPDLLELRVPLSLLAVGVITWGNLRGVRESGAMFGLPTYFFILAFSSMIVVGLVKLVVGDAPGSLLHSAEPSTEVAAASASASSSCAPSRPAQQRVTGIGHIERGSRSPPEPTPG